MGNGLFSANNKMRNKTGSLAILEHSLMICYNTISKNNTTTIQNVPLPFAKLYYLAK